LSFFITLFTSYSIRIRYIIQLLTVTNVITCTLYIHKMRLVKMDFLLFQCCCVSRFAISTKTIQLVTFALQCLKVKSTLYIVHAVDRIRRSSGTVLQWIYCLPFFSRKVTSELGFTDKNYFVKSNRKFEDFEDYTF
jgi:hypothetical protein